MFDYAMTPQRSAIGKDICTGIAHNMLEYRFIGKQAIEMLRHVVRLEHYIRWRKPSILVVDIGLMRGSGKAKGYQCKHNCRNSHESTNKRTKIAYISRTI